ncbi:MAG TPA: TIGR00725 family protein [Solirubrobacterales bacterium]|nr:TIGR00725 family protein [Solirubrobacterales bacterium]
MSGEAGPALRRRQIAVIGSGSCDEDSDAWQLAEEVGRRLAEAGATVVCGGLRGVMEAAARGAATAGGEAIGILPTSEPRDANPHCTHVVATGIGHGRNLAVVSSGEAVVAVGGEWGTLSEIGFARAIGRPVVALRSWTLKGAGEMGSAPGVTVVGTPEEAVRAALDPT